uniref:KI26B protein n=1 Tax=Macrostomum lignano TaxID=282301 RepID=A0A1I8FMQ7_9PLAT
NILRPPSRLTKNDRVAGSPSLFGSLGRRPLVESAAAAGSGPSKSPIQEADSDQEDSKHLRLSGLASTSGLEVSNPIFAGPDSDEE